METREQFIVLGSGVLVLRLRIDKSYKSYPQETAHMQNIPDKFWGVMDTPFPAKLTQSHHVKCQGLAEYA